MSFILSLGTLSFAMKFIVSVASSGFILLPTPCANWPNSLAADVAHRSLCFWSLKSCRQFRYSPVSALWMSCACSWLSLLCVHALKL
jgi:hypothetical protein